MIDEARKGESLDEDIALAKARIRHAHPTERGYMLGVECRELSAYYGPLAGAILLRQMEE